MGVGNLHLGSGVKGVRIKTEAIICRDNVPRRVRSDALYKSVQCVFLQVFHTIVIEGVGDIEKWVICVLRFFLLS